MDTSEAWHMTGIKLCILSPTPVIAHADTTHGSYNYWPTQLKAFSQEFQALDPQSTKYQYIVLSKDRWLISSANSKNYSNNQQNGVTINF